MTDPLTFFYQIPIVVERLNGSSAYEDTYDPPETILCRLRNKRKLIVGQSGAETVSESAASMPLNTPQIPVGSRVTPPNSHPRKVIAEARHETGTGATPDYYSIDLD